MSKPIKHIATGYPRTQREVLITFHPLLQEPTTQVDQNACKGINAALMSDKNINVAPFLYGRFSQNGNLILVTASHTQ
jgi:hypothetical protein